MAKVICSKCGVTGNSKCPHCRTVFPDNQMDAILSHVLTWKQKEEKTTIHYVCCTRKEGEEGIRETLHSLRNTLNQMENPESNYPSIDEYSCNHKWIFAPGEKSDISCGH